MDRRTWLLIAGGIGLAVSVAAAQPSGGPGADLGGNGPPITSPRQPQPVKPPPPVPPVLAVPLSEELRGRAAGVVEALASDERAVLRANAIEAAQRGLPTDAAKRFVVRGFLDKSEIVRFAACVAAGDLKLGDTRPVLYNLAYDADPSVRVAARYALHKLGDVSLSQEMLLGLRDDRPGVRSNTVMLLGMLGEKSAVKPLKHLVNDGVSQVRLQVTEALWRLEEQKALDDLVGRTVSRFPDEKIVAVIALAAPRNPRVFAHVRSLLVDEFPEVELAAARAAAMLGSDEGYGVALKYYKSKDWRQRSMSAMAFGEIGRSDAQDKLEGLLADESADVRLAAAAAILRLREPK
jgi:HEAT repeat protein